MAITTYSELQSAVADWLHRSDLTSKIPDFIALAEADMKVRAKLTQWDAEATVSLTSGSGTLPSGLDHINAVVYGTQTGSLQYLAPDRFKEYEANFGAGEPVYYTVFADTLRVTPTATGNASVSYSARFTSLSASATTNDLLTLFPDAYLHGSLVQAAIFIQDDLTLKRQMVLFEQAIARIKKYMLHRKYPQGLTMKVS